MLCAHWLPKRENSASTSLPLIHYAHACALGFVLLTILRPYAERLNGAALCDFTAVQLRERLKDLQDYVKRTEQEAQGAHRLIDAYRNNPSLGEAKTVEPKEELCKRRLQSLTALLEQLKDQFTKLGGEQSLSRPQFVPDSTRGNNLHSGPSFNSSLDSDLDEDPSQSAYGHPGQPPPQSRGVGRATVLYDYDGNGPDYPAAKAGEIFFVLQLDEDNSGWTMVVSEDGSREGFLPTGFIEVSKY
ncbi:unnamed protein product [Dicrocoelium dendriticum]|nr:unnamed protein product [Dicrocoelium dendriticum]